jgi:hypothetical protein
MLQLIALRSTIVVFIGLAALHLFLFNDLFEKIHSLRGDIIMAIKEQQPIPMAAPAQVAPAQVAPAQVAPAQVTLPKSVEDAEKWKNLVSMTSVVPRGW